jgi:hypothetical protein
MDGLQAEDEQERSGSRLHMEQLNAFKALKDPPHRRACCWFMYLVGNGLLGLRQACPQPNFG